MSDEQTTQPESDKDKNFQALREQKDALEAQVKELAVFRNKDLLRQAGFDPDTGEGKSLLRDITAGTVDADKDKLAEYAESEYGWKPKATLSPEESATVSSSQHSDQLRQSASDDGPKDTIDDQIAQARADGNWELAVVLENRKQYAGRDVG